MFSMFGSYDTRKVADPYDKDGVFVSTARVLDSAFPFETAVEHPQYNDGRMIIVESYDNIESAKSGHAKWIAKMTSSDLPDQLVDLGGSSISQVLDLFYDDENHNWRVYRRVYPKQS